MILVTGCTGYIGFHICEFLESKRLPYFGIDNFSRSHSKNIVNKKKFLKTDINSKIISSLVSSKKIHTIVQRNNIKKFIFLSSSNVYNFNSNNIKAASEGQKSKPTNYYGKTKSIIEKYLKNKFEICYILRLFNIAGYINKKEFFEFKNKFRRIMPVITEASRKKLPFKINLVKKKRRLIYPARDFVHIKDFLSIIFKILKRNNIGSYIMNVGSGELIYLDNIIKIFEKQMNKKISYKKKFYELGNNNYTLSNNYKLRKILDFDFKLSINEIVKSCIKKKVI